MTPTSERTIVVGLDNTPGALSALRWAVIQALRTGATIRAVHALELPGSAASLEHDIVGTRSAVQIRAHAWATDAIAGSPLRVPVTVEVQEGDAATVLGKAARDAGMLVLGVNAGTDHRALTSAPCRSGAKSSSSSSSSMSVAGRTSYGMRRARGECLRHSRLNPMGVRSNARVRRHP